MTFSARMKVQDVGQGPAPIDVLAVNDGEVLSNTEGTITGIEVRLQLGTDATGIRAGDGFTITGHLDARLAEVDAAAAGEPSPGPEVGTDVTATDGQQGQVETPAEGRPAES